jgi:hypothetical protein
MEPAAGPEKSGGNADGPIRQLTSADALVPALQSSWDRAVFVNAQSLRTQSTHVKTGPPDPQPSGNRCCPVHRNRDHKILCGVGAGRSSRPLKSEGFGIAGRGGLGESAGISAIWDGLLFAQSLAERDRRSASKISPRGDPVATRDRLERRLVTGTNK